MSSELVEARRQVFSPSNMKHQAAISNAAEKLRFSLRTLQRHDEYFVRTGMVFLGLYMIPIIPWSLTILIGLTAWLTHAYEARTALYQDYLDNREEALNIYDWARTDSSHEAEVDALEPFKKLTRILAEVTSPDRVTQPKDFIPESTLLSKLGGGMLSLVGWSKSIPQTLPNEENSEVKIERFPMAIQVFQYNPDEPHPAYQRLAGFAQEKAYALVKKLGGGVEHLPATFFSVAAAQLEAPPSVEKPKLS